MRRRPVEVERPISTDDIDLGDGRILPVGTEFSIKGQYGRFRCMYRWLPDGSISAWGPVNDKGSQDAQWRSFHPERVRTIHRKRKERV